MPSATRAIIIISIDLLKPTQIEKNPKNRVPMSRSFFRPNISPSLPAIDIVAQKEIMYAEITQSKETAETLNCLSIFGSATATDQ